MSPPRSRRRASLRAINGGGRPLIGFRAAGSHRVIDLAECHILKPELFALLVPLRRYFAALKGKYSIDIELAQVDQGVDCALKGFMPEGLDQTEDLLDFCRENGLARLTLDAGYGSEGFWEPEPVTVTLGGIPVAYPAGAFLQATEHGEAALVGAACEWLAGCGQVADLFAGLGTFALALVSQSKVLAAEADRAAVLACRSAVNPARLPVETAHRDLFRNPLRADELAGFDGILLDPPRAGARAQVEQIAASGVSRVVYISCNPSSWSRDGALLAHAGYELAELRPVGQFRWSTHVELASLFIKR
ncbi:class I SAM-dependent RNA methyltransferase [Erythrobacter alti]|uniref:class I SAM-dependent RNA methyltransferase n=1 Tax=Erythrobacter alti TaxID=1896145 RepID=UPI0030F3B156